MTEEKGDAQTVDSRRVPTEGGRTVLRREENWDSNLEAGSVSEDGASRSCQLDLLGATQSWYTMTSNFWD